MPTDIEKKRLRKKLRQRVAAAGQPVSGDSVASDDDGITRRKKKLKRFRRQLKQKMSPLLTALDALAK